MNYHTWGEHVIHYTTEAAYNYLDTRYIRFSMLEWSCEQMTYKGTNMYLIIIFNFTFIQLPDLTSVQTSIDDVVAQNLTGIALSVCIK